MAIGSAGPGKAEPAVCCADDNYKTMSKSTTGSWGVGRDVARYVSAAGRRGKLRLYSTDAAGFAQRFGAGGGEGSTGREGSWNELLAGNGPWNAIVSGNCDSGEASGRETQLAAFCNGEMQCAASVAMRGAVRRVFRVDR